MDSNFQGGPLVPSYDLPRGFRFAFRASTQRLVLAGVIPAVGNQPGAFGSQFRTSFQVTNPDSVEGLQGLTFVFHPRGVVGTGADPSTTLDAAPSATSADDLLARMNVTGVGSLDVYTPLWAPVMTTRVYNDTGSGTNGLSESLIPTSRALHNGEHGRIVFPSDLTNYRMNVGIRTLARTISLSAEQRDAAGNLIANFSRSYPANFFDQVSLASFAAFAPTDGGSIAFQVIGGDVILYATTTDNRTNDSAITIVTRD